LTTKQWKKIETKGTVPCKRQGHSSNLYNNFIIVFGGSTLSPLNDLYKYNLYDKEWSEISVIGVKPSPRHSHQTCIIQDKLYLYGGFHESYLDDFWMFHFKTSSWKEIDMSTMNCTPGKRIGHSLIARNGIIFLIFGNDGRDVNNDIYEFENGKWKKLTCTGDIPRKRAHHISVVSDRMFVFGGCDDDGQMNDFYIFNFGDEK
jgi:N-acetylneuraminic acid mutarotase